MVRRFLLLALFVAADASAQYPGAQAPPAQFQAGFRAIDAARAKEILGMLAGPSFRGRSPNNGDFDRAAGYVAARLQLIGIKPAGDDGSYFQHFSMTVAKPIPEKCSLRTYDGGLDLAFGVDFVSSVRDSGDWPVPPIAFLHVPSGSDLGALPLESLRGRWVFLSGATIENTDFTSYRVSTEGRARLADARFFAAARSLADGSRISVRYVTDYPRPEQSAIGTTNFTAEAIAKIARAASASKFLEAGKEASLEVPSVELVLRAEVAKTIQNHVNVVGILPGSDPVLKTEAVVIGSHLDHMGPGPGGTRFGADDNASGCTANLLIAEGMMKNPVKPRRSVVFGFWNLEEEGLHGSWYYVCRPSVPLEKTVAYLNMDMVGRDENRPRAGVHAKDNARSVYPGSVKTNSMDLHALLERNNRFVGLTLKDDYEDRTNRSDTRNFFEKGIPTLKVFTGEHEDYHRPGDTVDKINWTKMISIARWIYLSAQDLASRPDRPRFERKPFVPPKN